jgi:hypothetical protein
MPKTIDENLWRVPFFCVLERTYVPVWSGPYQSSSCFSLQEVGWNSYEDLKLVTHDLFLLTVGMTLIKGFAIAHLVPF